MSTSKWPTFEKPPSVAFVDVDGTLLAHTTTFLFARILYRRGGSAARSSSAHSIMGCSIKFGRLDYGRLIEIGLTLHLADSRRRAGADRLRELRRIRPAEALRGCRGPSQRVADDPGRRSCWSRRRRDWSSSRWASTWAARDLLTTPVVIERGRLIGIGSGPPCYGEGKLYYAREWAARTTGSRSVMRSPTPTTGAIGPCWSRSDGRRRASAGPAAPPGPSPGVGYRPAPTAGRASPSAASPYERRQKGHTLNGQPRGKGNCRTEAFAFLARSI